MVLFSGGLDSLAGALDELLGPRKRIVLVSHYSSTKLASRQRDLARALRQRAPDRVLHVPVKMTKRSGLTVEYSQRSRSFFFVALGAVVAKMLGTNRIRLYENGIVSLNLPIAENVVGARATRSTHPTVITGLNRLLAALLESSLAVDNPYGGLTKTEVVKRIDERGCAELMALTVSCSRVYQIETDRPHCGECTQCLGRRFAILGAGLAQHDPEDGYRVRLFVDGRPDPARRVLAVSYIELARQLGRMSAAEFLARFGLELTRAIGDMPGDREVNLRQLFELHQRHGTSVTEILADAFHRHADELAEGKLPDTCLVRLAAAPDATPDQVGQAEREELRVPREKGEAPTDTDGVFNPENMMLALDHEKQQVVIESLDVFSGDQMFPLFACLVDLRDDDMVQKRRDDNYKFMTPETLANKLGFDDAALRALIYRTRGRISEAAEKVGAPALSRNDVIEGKRSIGYRLSRAVRVVALSEIRR